MLRALLIASLAHQASIVSAEVSPLMACVLKVTSVPVVKQQLLPREHSTSLTIPMLSQAHARSAIIVPLVQAIPFLAQLVLSWLLLANPNVLLVPLVHIVLQLDLLP